MLGAVKDTRTNAHLLNAAIWMQNAKAPLNWGPRKAAQCGIPAEKIFGGVKTSTLCGEKEQPRAGQRKAALSSGFLAV